jgi:hypothetical protein
MQQTIAVVVLGSLNKEARRLGCVPVFIAALREQSEGDERVQQYAEPREFAWIRLPICSAFAPSPTAVKMSSSSAVRIQRLGT